MLFTKHRAALPAVPRFCFVARFAVQACSISSSGAEPPSSLHSLSQTATAQSGGRTAAQDLPALLQASLGIRDGCGAAAAAGPPFIKASTVSEVVKVAIAVAPPADAAAPTAAAAAAAAAASSARPAALEGLLGVLAAGASEAGSERGGTGADDGGAPEDDPALATVRREGLSLLLAAFSGFGGGRGGAADRLWRDCGAPVLEALVVAGGKASAAAPAPSPTAGDTLLPRRRGGIWQDFLDGAVERTRQAMEDDGSGDGGGTAPDQQATAERAATLAWALVELQGTLRRWGAALPEEDVPVLWRLGLTRPSVWRGRRLEARALAGTGAATAADLARACVGSRWARRWECVSLILARLPDARARLSLLMEGVVPVDDMDGDRGGDGGGGGGGGNFDEVAGEALHEILAAGVVASRAERLLRGKGYGGMSTSGGLTVDLPPRLLSRPSRAVTTTTLGGGGSTRESDPVQEFGVGLPTFRGFLPAAAGMEQPGAVATVASAGVLDAAAVHLGENSTIAFGMTPVARAGGEAMSKTVADRAGPQPQQQQQQQHPFTLLLPRGLCEVAFEPPAGGPLAHAADDARLHEILLSALLSGVRGMAEDAAAAPSGGKGGGAGEAGAWRVSCSAEISVGLLVAVVGETFVRGLGLGDDANRCVCVCVCVCACVFLY